MNIFVCVKPVFGTDDRIKIIQGSDIQSSIGQVIVNPFDEYAIEESLRLKEIREGSTVTAVSYGKEGQESVSLSALAIGVDIAVFIMDRKKAFSMDSCQTAAQLFHYFQNESPDCILMGKEAVDTQNGAVGSILASLLGIPIATNVNKCSFETDYVEVERTVSGSIQQKIQMKFPCIITVTKGINKPRYPSIRGILNAKKKPLLKLQERDLAIPYEHPGVVFDYPQERKKCQIIEPEEQDISDQILKILNIS